MTEKEEKLLLKDLAARVPYGVMVEQTLFPSSIADKEQRLKNVQANNCVQLYWYEYINDFVPIHCIKPYLRPMSSMTGEEWCEYCDACLEDEKSWTMANRDQLKFVPITNREDYLNSHHFDYRGLIDKGLAIEAPEGMYE